MTNFELPSTAADVAKFLEAKVVGDVAAPVHQLCQLDEASEGKLSFFSNKKYLPVLTQLRGAVLLTSPEFVRPELPLTYVVVEDPRYAFSQLAKKLALRPRVEGVSPLAAIHPTAKLEVGVRVGPFAVISEHVEIGKNTVVSAHCYIGIGVKIGKDCELFPRVTLLDKVELGDRVKIFPGSVIGSDGFGYFSQQGAGKLTEMPQIGSVVIEDDVRIGALSTIDRGTLGETRIGAQTKIDDHVHIGHNTQVGKGCLFCGQAGIAGSSVLEDGVILGGQAGVSDHVRMGKNSVLGAQAGLSANVPPGEYYFASPAVPVKEALKMVRSARKLPELEKRLKELEKRLEEHG